MMSYKNFLKINPDIKKLDPTDFPDDLKISTITQKCCLPVKFNVISIAKKLPLSSDFVQTVKCGNSGEIFRSININHKRKMEKKIKFSRRQNISNSTKNFYNQVTIIVSSNNNIKMNIKIFSNGSMQITGSTNISSVLWALDCLFKIIKSISIDMQINCAFPMEFLNIQDIYDHSICMINSNFNVGFKINREILFDILVNDGYECNYDPARYAGVKLSYKTSDNDTENISTIPIFASGAIIITGSKSFRELINCYKFINIYLIEKYSEIVKLD